jgi:hypothetical protein
MLKPGAGREPEETLEVLSDASILRYQKEGLGDSDALSSFTFFGVGFGYGFVPSREREGSACREAHRITTLVAIEVRISFIQILLEFQ